MNKLIYIIIAGTFTYFVITSYSTLDERNPKIYLRDGDKHLTLMGQFNYNSSSNDITTWFNSWSQIIESKDIIMAVPDCESQNYPKMSPSSYLCYKSDMGFYSPYENIAKILKMAESKSFGILYVHDDMLITSSLINKIEKINWAMVQPSHRVIKMYKNGTIFGMENGTKSTDDDCKIMQNGKMVPLRNCHKIGFWQFWPWHDRVPGYLKSKLSDYVGCHTTFINIMKDPDITTFLHKPKNEDPYINIQFGQSDLLYAFFPNAMQKEYFIKILDLFSKHRLFLECAIPTAVLMMKQKFGVSIYNPRLCTKWTWMREKPESLIRHCARKGHHHEAYHPFKPSRSRNWSMYFNKIYHM